MKRVRKFPASLRRAGPTCDWLSISVRRRLLPPRTAAPKRSVTLPILPHTPSVVRHEDNGGRIRPYGPRCGHRAAPAGGHGLPRMVHSRELYQISTSVNTVGHHISLIIFIDRLSYFLPSNNNVYYILFSLLRYLVIPVLNSNKWLRHHNPTLHGAFPTRPCHWCWAPRSLPSPRRR